MKNLLRILFLTCLGLFGAQRLSAQVEVLGLGFGGSLMDYKIDQTGRTWVGVDVSGLYYSDDRGKQWHLANNQPVNEHISEIFVHPEDPNLVILGVRGGILRSEDRGQSWEDVRQGLPDHVLTGKMSIAIVSICTDPFNTDILYAAMGDRREASKVGMDSGEAKYGRGLIFKSEDRGKSWINLREEYSTNIPEMANIFAITASNQFEGTLFAASSRGLYRSQDAGLSWRRMSRLPHQKVLNVVLDPRDNNRVFVTIDSEANGYGVYFSDDLGNTWEARNNGLPERHNGQPIQPYHLLMNPKDPATMYVGGTENGAIWKTTNGGEKWSNVYTGRVRDQGWFSYGTGYLKAYGFDISPTDPEYLIAGEHWSHKTENGGGDWYNVYSSNSSPYTNNGIDFTVSDVVEASPYVDGLVLMGQYDNGLYLSRDGGKTWENKHHEMRKDGTSSWLVSVTDIAFANNGDIYVAIELSFYNPNGGFQIKKSTDNGKSWQIVMDAKQGSEFHSWGMYRGLEIDPNDPQTLYVTAMAPNDHATIVTHDGGESWEKIGEKFDNNLIRELHLDQSDPNILYAVAATHNGKIGRLYKSTDKGANWVTINEDPLYDARDMAIDPNDNNTLYMAVSTAAEGQRGGVYKSTDGGVHWTGIATKESNTLSDEFTDKIAVNGGFFGASTVTCHPTNSNIIYATFGAATGQTIGDFRPAYGLGVTYDGGASWSLVGTESIRYGRLFNVAFDPRDENIIYSGSGGAGGFKINLQDLKAADQQFEVFKALVINSPESVTVQDFETLGIQGVVADSLTAYVAALEDQIAAFTMIGQVQLVVDQVNTPSLQNLEKILAYINEGQPHRITNNMMEAEDFDDYQAQYLSLYQQEFATMANVTERAEIQAVIEKINPEGHLAMMNAYSAQNDKEQMADYFSLLEFENRMEEYEQLYIDEIYKLNTPFSMEDIQATIDLVNEAQQPDKPLSAGEEALLTVYPQPANEVLKIAIGQQIEEVRLFSVLGNEYAIRVDQGQINQVDVRHIPEGIYILQVATAQHIYGKKVIIRHE